MVFSSIGKTTDTPVNLCLNRTPGSLFFLVLTTLSFHVYILAREEPTPTTLDDEDLEDFKKAFTLLDGDENGEITKTDLSNFIKAHLGKTDAAEKFS